MISAHRGGAMVEGKSAAQRYQHAIALGVDFVEFDVRRTKDSVSIVFHDERTPSGRPIHNFSYLQLIAELGSEALTYEELLSIAGGKVGLHLDLKEAGYEADVVTAALDASPGDALVITGGDEVIRNVKEQFPDVHAGLSLGEELDGATPLRKLQVRLSEVIPRRRIAACRADFVAVHWQLAELNVLHRWARRGLPAWVWTVDDEARIKQFMNDRRVAVLITNRPELALRIRST